MIKILTLVIIFSCCCFSDASAFNLSRFDNIDSVYIKTLPDSSHYCKATILNGNDIYLLCENSTEYEISDSILMIRPLSRDEFEQVWSITKHNKILTAPNDIKKIMSLICRLEYDAHVAYSATQSVKFIEFSYKNSIVWSVGEYGDNIAQIILFKGQEYEIIWISKSVYIGNSRFRLSTELMSYLKTIME